LDLFICFLRAEGLLDEMLRRARVGSAVVSDRLYEKGLEGLSSSFPDPAALPKRFDHSACEYWTYVLQTGKPI